MTRRLALLALVLGIAVLHTPVTAQPSTGLLAYWQMEETGAAARTDDHNGHDLTASGVAETNGIIGNAAEMSASTENLSAADHADFSPANRDWSLAFWTRLNSTSGTPIAAHKGWFDSGQAEWRIWRNNTNSRFTFTVSSDGTTNSTTGVSFPLTINTATWYFVVVTHDAANDLIGISVNGAAKVTAAYASGVFDGTGSFMFGSTTSGIIGRVDQAGLWSVVLSDADISWLYNGGAGRTYAEIAASPPARLLLLGVGRP